MLTPESQSPTTPQGSGPVHHHIIGGLFAQANGDVKFHFGTAVNIASDSRTMGGLRFAVLIMEEHEFISLQLITKHIDDVEALGDIGTINMDAISKALSKARSLYVRFPPSCSSSLNCDFQDARERPAILYIN